MAFVTARNASAQSDATVWIELATGIYRISSEVANTYPLRDIGLSTKQMLGINQGMLFIFPQIERHCIWMRNTRLPLSAAFIDEQGKIVNIEEMEPQTDTYHCARRKVRYVLEMGTNWFNKRRIMPGALISGIHAAPPAQ